MITTKRLRLIPHFPPHLLALLNSVDDYERESGFQAADSIREFLISSSPQFKASLQTATQADPWRFGFAVLDRTEPFVIGMCGFTGPPTTDGAVEFGYGIAPKYQSKGYATEVASALVNFAAQDQRVKTVRAYTLAEPNASTRVLEKCGFKKNGETVDPENSLAVWRWERTV